MRALLVLPQSGVGGLHHLVRTIGPRLEEAGVEVVAMVQRSNPEAQNYLSGHVHRVVGADLPIVRRVRHGLVRPLPGPRLLSRLGDAAGPDISTVQSFGFLDVTGPRLAKRLGVPHVLSCNSSLSAFPVPLLRPAIRRQAAWFLAEGRGVAEAHSLPSNRTTQFYPPVPYYESEWIVENRRRFRQDLGLSPDDRLIGMFSNISPQKGADRLLDLLERTNESHPAGLVFVIAGRCTSDQAWYLQQLTDRVRELRLKCPALRVELRPDIVDRGFITALDGYTMMSRFEGVATTTLEAIACGVPVIAHPVGSVFDIVTGEGGYRMKGIDDRDGFIDALRSIRDGSSRSALTRAARCRADDMCSLAGLVDAYVGAHRSACW